jgi:hypothetical protein
VLLGAYLEFYLDVDAREVGDVVNPAPWLDVYALAGTIGESLGEEDFAAAATPPGNVLLGENRRVLRDVTDIVRGYLANPQSNHGLVLGSLRGLREGLFTVQTGVLAEGIVAQLIIHYRDA